MARSAAPGDSFGCAFTHVGRPATDIFAAPGAGFASYVRIDYRSFTVAARKTRLGNTALVAKLFILFDFHRHGFDFLAFSVEHRHPFLDEFVRFSIQIHGLPPIRKHCLHPERRRL